jgi:hypothetical protein
LIFPSRLELRAVGNDDQERDPSYSVDQQIKQLERRRISPMKILE